MAEDVAKKKDSRDQDTSIRTDLPDRFTKAGNFSFLFVLLPLWHSYNAVMPAVKWFRHGMCVLQNSPAKH
jgi:hypothetical protein